MHKALVSRTQPKDGGGDSFGGSITSTDTYSFKSPSKLGVNSIAEAPWRMRTQASFTSGRSKTWPIDCQDPFIYPRPGATTTDDSSLAALEDTFYTIDHYGVVEVETIKPANGTSTTSDPKSLRTLLHGLRELNHTR